MIYDLRFTIFTMAAILLLFVDGAPGQTPAYYSGQISPGVAQTNPLVFTPWPPSPPGPAFVAVGTNLIFLATFTNTPNAAGFFSNVFWPVAYKVTIPAFGSGAFFYATIPNTTNYQSLMLYATNVVVAGGVQTSAAVIAAMIGFTPVADTYAALVTAAGFTFATNGGPLAYSQLPYTPPTNTYAGLTNVAGFVFATNNPVANTNVFVTAIVTNNLGYATNVLTGTNIIKYEAQ